MREHRQQHRRAEPDEYAQLARGIDLRRSQEFHSCLVQSFDRDRCNSLWLPVLPGPSAKETQQKQSFGQILLTSCQSALKSPALPTTSAANRNAVLPFFLQNGSYDLIHSMDPDYILKLIQLPEEGEHGFHVLKLAIGARYRSLCNDIPNVPDQIRTLLVAPRPGERGMIGCFNRPSTKSTISSYALEEVRLLCFVLRCIRRHQYSVGGSESPVPSPDGLSIALTTQQFDSLQALLLALSSQSTPTPLELNSLIDAALHSIYMPSNSFHMFDNVFRNPCIVYVVLRSTRAQGGFADPKDITVYYAQIQFGIRLALMAKVQKEHCRLQAAGDGQDSEELYKQFMEYAQVTIRRWGSEEHISPLAFVRQCMKAMSRLARNAPSRQTVMWNADHTRLAVQSHLVVISEYLNRVHSSLSSLASKIDSDILFGVEFSPGSFDLPTSETNDLKTLGFSLFALDAEADIMVEDHPASYFLQQLCSRGELCIRQGDEIIWDVPRLSDWLLSVSEVWAEALTLMQLLSLPGRGTEVTSWQHANSTTSPRHLFVSQNLGTLITHSNYNKTTALTGQYKYILRVIPYALSVILIKLLRIVRPVEMLAFASNAPAGDRLEIQNTYATYIFVSHGKVWNSARLSASLRSWFLRELKVPFGLQLHRHFAQALQRRFLSYKKTNELYKTANDVMGHGSEVADHHYARETDDLNLDTSERHRMEQVGVDWITKVHKLDVSPTL
ncbi:hypothetical protein JVU11DRAFT_2176 [Chiua virens]|nr:hypothetical protein JVU11DRAFT_2176 [Chiua virens]